MASRRVDKVAVAIHASRTDLVNGADGGPQEPTKPTRRFHLYKQSAVTATRPDDPWEDAAYARSVGDGYIPTPKGLGSEASPTEVEAIKAARKAKSAEARRAYKRAQYAAEDPAARNARERAKYARRRAREKAAEVAK